MAYRNPSLPASAPGTDPAPGLAPGLAPGVVLAGRYRLLQRVSAADSRDEVARTWRALDEVLARPVCLRTVPAHEPRATAFLAAAARAGALQTRLTSRVYDAAVDTAPGRPPVAYFVGEWVHGQGLADALADGPLPLGRALTLMVEATEALSVTHAAGVVHGRLHPGNVLLDTAGRLRLADTAVAAALLPDGAGDPAGDVRDLGAVLYALVTARWPQACTGQPGRGLPAAPTNEHGTCSPRQVRAGVPRSLDRLVVRALAPRMRTAKQPSTAPLESADALLAALEQVSSEVAGARLGGVRRRGWLPGRL